VRVRVGGRGRGRGKSRDEGRGKSRGKGRGEGRDEGREERRVESKGKDHLLLLAHPGFDVLPAVREGGVQHTVRQIWAGFGA
jgi:hypothetical protein